MIRTGLISASLLLLFVLVFAAGQPTGHANAATTSAGTAADQAKCSDATLKGRYLFAHKGTILPPAFGVTEATPGADAGIHTFNGDGTGTDTVTVRVGAAIVLDNQAIPFTYTVSADCTGHMVVSQGPSFNIYVAPKGESVALIATAPDGNYPSDIDYRVSK